MQVFISWSGERSRKIAAALRDWLPLVIQALDPWFSPEDIDKGARWLADLNSQLQQRSVALICLTPENLTAPWLLFEAGALSKAIDSSCVSPVLLGVEPVDLEGPLAQFQATALNQTDIRRLLATLNRRLEKPLDERQIDTAFALLWPQLESQVHALLKAGPAGKVKHRPESSILDEVLSKVRTIERHIVETKVRQAAPGQASGKPAKQDSPARSAPHRARTPRLTVSLAQALSELKTVEASLRSLADNATDERTRLLEKKERLETRIGYFHADLADQDPRADRE